MIRHPRSTKMAIQALVGGVLVLAVACGPAHVPAQAAYSQAGYPPLVIEDGPVPFVQHFNPFLFQTSGTAVPSTYIYEPLLEVDSIQHKYRPWLATSYHWSKDLKTLTFSLRHGVKWSDGVPFTAKDVYFTLVTLPKKYPVTDQAGLWVKGGPNEASTVTIPASDQIAIRFKEPNLQRLYTLADGLTGQGVLMLPEHIWAHVKNPTTWQDGNPVGTGPYTQVKHFTPQSFDLGKNPYYWQPLAADTIRLAGYTSADAARLALEAGQLDWSTELIPHADKLLAARNPHLHYWYPPDVAMEPLYVNLKKYPFSLLAFRQALSMAINRQAIDTDVYYGNQPPSDATALTDISGRYGPLPTWRDPSIPNTVVEYNLAAARALLQKAGFTWRNGNLIDPRGHRVAFEFLPLYANAALGQIVQQNWKALGIDVDVKLLQWSPFYDRVQHHEFDALWAWGMGGGPSPYWHYFDDLVPTSGTDFEQWQNPQMERLLARFSLTADPSRQRELAYRMERIFVDNLPFIPTVVENIPGDYNTTNYTGFPSARNPYAAPPPSTPMDALLVLTHLRRTH